MGGTAGLVRDVLLGARLQCVLVLDHDLGCPVKVHGRMMDMTLDSGWLDESRGVFHSVNEISSALVS